MMGRGLGDIVNTLLMLLPPWAVAVLVVLLLVVAIPGWRYSTRHKQVKGTVRRLVRAPPELADTLRDRAFERAGEDPHLVAIIARDARTRGLPDLYDRALRRLDELPGGPAVAREVRGETAAKAIDPIHPVEAAVRIETLIEQGALEAARLRLDEALEQHPRDPTLCALREQLRDATEPPVEATTEPVGGTLDATDG